MSEHAEAHRRLADVVDALEDAGELLVQELSEELDVTTTTIHNNLAPLREAGLVESRKDPRDGRRSLYRLEGTDPVVGVASEDAGDEEVEEQDEIDREQIVLDVLEEDGPMQAKDLREAVAEQLEITPSGASEIHEEMFHVGEVARWAHTENGNYTYYGLPDQEPEEQDVEHEFAWPRECGECGATLEGTLEGAVHRTEEHGSPQSHLDHLEPGEFGEHVEEADSVGDLVDELPWDTTKTLRLLGIYGLEHVVGGDVELSDVSDVEIDAVDSDSGGDATPEDTTQVVEEDRTAARLCMDNGLDREDVVDAIADAQAVYHVQRDLTLTSEDTQALLESLGLYEDLDRGGYVERDRVKEAVIEQVPPPAAADGGGGA